MGNPEQRQPLSRLEHPPEKPLPTAAEQRTARLASGNVVIVCGGRDYGDRDRVFAALDMAHARKPITLLVHGACMDKRRGELMGADRWADEWAGERGVAVERHPADWLTWARAAGPMRNKQMVEAGAHGCIAFPGGSGTASMVGYAKGFGLPIWRPFGE